MGDRYTITERVDQGGMAEVFRGVAESIQGFRKSVAIKRILPNLTKNKKFVAMFLDEARLSLHLQHANIVHVFDIGMGADTAYFIVMEYVDGANLKAIIEHHKKQGRRIKISHALYLMLEVCKGLACAHEAQDPMSGKPLGIVHRDISPPNILISKMGEVKLVDFGLAKATSQIELTDPGVVKGKFSYLSPEAASGLEVDHRADIFAVGILLWEMLTGRRLFYGDSDYGTVELVRQAKVPSVIALNPEVEPELEQVVRKALARDPKDRYAQAADLQDAIAQYLFSRGLKVTSRDIAHLVQDTVAEKERAKAKTAGNVSHLIDVLIQEEIAKFTSLEDMAGKQQDNTPASTTGGDALDPGAFIDTRAWVDDLSTEGDAALLNGASRATHETQDEPKEARRRTPPALPKVSQQAASALDSLQQILEPDRTITRQLLARGKRRGKAALVIIVVLVLALAVGGVVYFRDRLPGARPAGAETQGNNP